MFSCMQSDFLINCNPREYNYFAQKLGHFIYNALVVSFELVRILSYL